MNEQFLRDYDMNWSFYLDKVPSTDRLLGIPFLFQKVQDNKLWTNINQRWTSNYKFEKKLLNQVVHSAQN